MPTPPTNVVVHPLVLLSVVDHYNRVAKDSRRRVVGVLLGETWKGSVDITNSFAVPFEEESKDPTSWYLDHSYLESMAFMFKKINAKEKIVGFYSTGPKIRPADIDIDALFRRYHPHPALVIIDIRPDVEGIPVQAYVTQEAVMEDSSETRRTFTHVPAEVGAYEAEEVGVEHLLRDVNDPSVSSLGFEVRHKLQALKGLAERLKDMSTYLEDVLTDRMPANNQILNNMQTITNLLPNLNVESLVKSMFGKTNDLHLVMYIASLVRSVIALHNLVNNKIKFKDTDEVDDAVADAEPAADSKSDDASDDKAESTDKDKDSPAAGGAGGGAGAGSK